MAGSLRMAKWLRSASLAVLASTLLATGARAEPLTLQEVLLSVARAYFSVVASEAQLGYRRDNVDLLTQNQNDTQQRVNIGDVTLTDLQLVQSRVNSAMADVAFAEANLASARADFARAV